MISISVFSIRYKQFFAQNLALYIIAIVTYLILTYAIFCYKSVRRNYPLNYICLAIYTLAFCYAITGITGFTHPDDVLLAAGATAVATIALTLYAFYTKRDFTYCGGLLFVILFSLILVGVVAIFVRSKILEVLLSTAFALLYSIYLIYDTQLVVGKGRYKLEIDDYIVGAIIIFIDIMMIFLEILKILAVVRGNN